VSLPEDHVCKFCGKPTSGSVHHKACRLHDWTEPRAEAELRWEFEDAVKRIKSGQMARVSDACMSVYGKYIAKQRELAQGKRGGRNTSNV